MPSADKPARPPSRPGPDKTARPAAAGAERNPANGGRTLGPVSDLERHLPADWWGSLFNALYLQTDGDVVENAENTRRDVDLLIQAGGLGLEDRVLDLCCGQGRHALELARRGFRRVTGLDRSRFLIRLARRRARQEGLAVSFHEGDARKFRIAESAFDCVAVMGNSFGYFDLVEDDLRVLEMVKRALRSSGLLAMDLTDGGWIRDHFERRSWEWIDQNQFVCRERSVSSDGDRLITREVVVDAEKGVLADQLYAERLYTRETIQELLDRAGFTDPRFHEQAETASDRNQDLGMMARRMFLTAVGPRKVAAARRGAVPYPDVTVLLGDPRRPDEVKLGGKFNPEDVVTVEKLKDAMAELGEYRVTYLDDHARMIQELSRNPPSFVFNLCDEGFDNDAFKELHVPSYLEMLGVPYSGAGPACLGLCYDKSLVRAIAQSIDIPVPLETYADPDDLAATVPAVFPALIKPAQGDSSVGITSHALVRTTEEAVAYLDYLRETLPGRSILIQEFLSGAEYSVAIIGNSGQGYNVLPVLEVDYSRLPSGLPPILAYESKWEPDSPYWTKIGYKETDAPEEVRRALIDFSIRLFERLGCRDYARFDFRADADGQVKLLEVNPNPGWCWDGKLNLMAGFADIRYAELLRQILEAAQARLVPAMRAAQALRRSA